MLKKIIFYAASSENIPKNKIGGAEVGAKRTYDFLSKNGYDVSFIPKITLYKGIKNFILEYFKTKKVLKKMFKENKEDAIFYITAFYKKQNHIEKKFVSMAKKSGLKIVYEPKNGSFVKRYNEGNKIYKNNILKTLKMSDCIFCQGQEYVEFITKLTNANCVYIPNYVEKIDDGISINNGILDLVYFGRVTEQKNVELIIDICHELSKKNEVTCKIIGAGEEEYINLLTKKIETLDLNQQISILGRMPIEQIKEIVLNCDFFVFPSNESEEGHSNALTEAMSFGLVPVVSNKGFNKSVVGDCEYVVEEFSIEDYANRILKLNENLEENKIKCKERIKQNFVSNIVLERQLKALENL